MKHKEFQEKTGLTYKQLRCALGKDKSRIPKVILKGLTKDDWKVYCEEKRKEQIEFAKNRLLEAEKYIKNNYEKADMWEERANNI